MDILDDMEVSKLSAKVCLFFKVNYSFNVVLNRFDGRLSIVQTKYSNVPYISYFPSNMLFYKYDKVA